MMKKISKLALLAAATAFLLAAFPACDNDDGNETELDNNGGNTGGDDDSDNNSGNDGSGDS